MNVTDEAAHVRVIGLVAERWNHGCKLLARMHSQFWRFWTQIEIHPGAQIASGVFIDHGSGLCIECYEASIDIGGCGVVDVVNSLEGAQT